MAEKTRGIVLSTQNYSETSLITRIYTQFYGMQSYIVKGAKRKRSSINPALLQAPTLVELVASHNNKNGLHHLRSINCDPPFHNIASNPEKRTLAVFLADLLYRSIREEEENENLFDFIDYSFRMFDEMTINYNHFHLYFMLQLTKFLGCYPGNSINGDLKYFDIIEGRFTDSQSETDMIADLQTSSLINDMLISGMKCEAFQDCSREDERKLFHTLIQYYEHHHLHGKKIKSRYLIDEVLN